MSTCKSCGAEIVWCIGSKGGRMPVDANPNPGGNLTIVEDHANPTLPPRAMPVPPDAGVGTPRYKSHFATCPSADQHRRPKP